MIKRILEIDEEATVEWMIRYYCRKNHDTGTICLQCLSLLNYASERISRCPHGDAKPVCSSCTIHCYKKEFRNKIIEVMRYSGPRIMLHKPLTGIRYLLRKKFY